MATFVTGHTEGLSTADDVTIVSRLVNVADTAAASASVVRYTVARRTVPDTITGADALTAKSRYGSRPIDASLTSSGTTRTAVFLRSTTDVSALVEQSSFQGASSSFVRRVFDVASVSESPTRAARWTRAIPDTDSVTHSSNFALTAQINDSAPADAVLSLTVIFGDRDTNDSVSVTDTVGTQRIFARPTSETTSGTASLLTRQMLQRAIQESVPVNDAITRAGGLNRSLHDSVDGDPRSVVLVPLSGSDYSTVLARKKILIRTGEMLV